MTKKRILIIDESLGFGGAISSIGSALRHIEKDNYEFYVILSFKDTKFGEDYFKAKKVYQIPRYDIQAPKNVRRFLGKFVHKLFCYFLFTINIYIDHIPRLIRYLIIIENEKINIVHTNSCIRTNLVGIIAAKISRRPCISHIRNYEKIFGMTKKMYDRKFIKRIIVNTNDQKKFLIKQNVREADIEQICEGIEMDKFNRKQGDNYLFETLSIPRRELSIGMVGMLTRWKGQEVLINAVNKIKDSISNFYIFFIGDTITKGDSYKGYLMSLVKEFKLDENIIFTGLRNDISDILPSLDIFVHASINPEPFGRVIIEAMAASLSVIASDAGGPLEIIENGYDGLLFNMGDSDDLAKKLLSLVEDSSFRKVLGMNARKKVEKNFLQKNLSDELERIYNKI